MPDPQPVDQASWDESVYTYQPARPHAVTDVDRPGSESTNLSYDANGDMACRPHWRADLVAGDDFASPTTGEEYWS